MVRLGVLSMQKLGLVTILTHTKKIMLRTMMLTIQKIGPQHIPRHMLRTMIKYTPKYGLKIGPRLMLMGLVIPILRYGQQIMLQTILRLGTKIMKKHTIKFGTKYIPSLGKKVTLRIMIKSMLLTILDRMEVQQPI